MRRVAAIILAASCAAAPATAKTSIDIQPVQIGAETVRYSHGVGKLDLVMTNGAIQVRPIPRINDNLRFVITVYNNGTAPADFDITNVYVTAADAGVGIYTPAQYIAREKERAVWGQIGMAVLGGVAAGLSASQTSTYRSHLYTPHGSYTFVSRYPSYAGQAAAADIVAGTSWTIGAMQDRLDRTAAAIGEQAIARTTIDPGDSYSGFIILRKIEYKMPVVVKLTVSWNGEQYPFEFQIVKPGTPAPPFTAITRKADLIEFRQQAALVQAAQAQAALAASKLASAQQHEQEFGAEASDTSAIVQRDKRQITVNLVCVTCR